MYDNNYGYTDYSGTTGLLGGLAAIGGFIMIVSLVIGIITLVSQWKIYKKAGKKGWEAIIPIYNMVVLLQIVELPTWYIILFFVPIANIYAMFKMYIELAHKFGKSTGFGVATVFFNFICLPILAFGKNNVYNGGNNQPQTNNNMTNNQYNPSVSFENGLNNNEINSNTAPVTSMFNQNIDTHINTIQNVADANNNTQNVTNENILLEPSPIVNPQQEVNVIPTVPLMATESVNNVTNVPNTESVAPTSQATPFVYNPNGSNVTPEVTESLEPTINNEVPTTPEIPVTLAQPQVINVVPTPQPVNNVQPEIQPSQPNITPSVGTIQTPNADASQNNTTM